MIPLFKPFICQEAKDNVQRVLGSSWLGLGPETEAFEKEFAAYIGAKHAIATNSGTEALRLAVHISSRGTKEGYAISTPNTFIASNSVLVQNGMYPIFTDIDCDTGFMKKGDVEHALRTYECGLIMVVHYGGYPDDPFWYEDISREYDIDIIHDCAHATGAEWRGIKLGAGLKYACYSFHAVKPLPIGEGGALVTNSDEVAERARHLRWFGIDKSTFQRTKGSYTWDYDISDYGYKGHMWDVQATIGRAQLKYLDGWIKDRSRLVDRYRKNLISCDFPIPIKSTELINQSAHHLFVIRFKNKEQRQKAMEALAKEDIQYGFHYKANYRYTPYSTSLIVGTKDMELWEETALSLPLFLTLKEEEVDFICDTILEAI